MSIPAAEKDASSRALRDVLLSFISREYSVSIEDLLSPSRGKKPIADARMMAMWMIWSLNNHNASSAGRVFERDPTTALSAIDGINNNPARREEGLKLLKRYAQKLAPPAEGSDQPKRAVSLP